jgi:hypothetical protein
MPKPFTEYTPEDFETMIGTNVAGYFFEDKCQSSLLTLVGGGDNCFRATQTAH